MSVRIKKMRPEERDKWIKKVLDAAIEHGAIKKWSKTLHPTGNGKDWILEFFSDRRETKVIGIGELYYFCLGLTARSYTDIPYTTMVIAEPVMVPGWENVI